MDKKIKIGLIGLGTVGSGVFKTLRNFKTIEIVKIAVRDINKPRNIDGLDKAILTDNIWEVVDNKDIDIVVELIGGLSPAYELIQRALENGKHIVTANKELLAKRGKELFDTAQKCNRVILYEAAIAGGIPLIMPVKTILAGNRIDKIEAIVNGTTNYILTKMDKDAASYDDVLREAQNLGYAEADPTGDVEGFDAAYKIAVLSSITFKKRVDINKIYREGITKIRVEDMESANDLGYKIKLIASARLDGEGRADVRVHPMLVSKDTTLAHIDYVTNAVSLSGYPVGDITLSGPGAGEFPTASSVIGDILSISSELGYSDYILPMMRCIHNEDAEMVDIKDTFNKYYISIRANNNMGVIGKIGTICAQNNISLASIVQKCVSKDNTADITVITEVASERAMQNAVELIEQDGNKVNSLIRVQV